VLVKDQSTGADNGIYVVAAGAWARSADADTSAEVTAGLYCYVTEGTANGDSGWILTTNDPITLGSTALTFVQFTGAGQIIAGNGIVKSGNTLHAAQSGAYTAGGIVFASSTSALGFDASNFFYDSGNHRLGLLTTAPTHTLTLGDGSAIAFYGTADQTVDYGRLLVLNGGLNAFTVLAQYAGAADAAQLSLAASNATGADSATLTLATTSVSPVIQLVSSSWGIAGDFFVVSPFVAGSSSSQNVFAIKPSVNQTATAGYTALLVDVTETTIGSGARALAQFSVGGAARMILTSAGLFGLGRSPTALFDALLSNATTNAVSLAAIIAHNSSGTVANGFGTRLEFDLQDSTTADQFAGAFDISWTVATHASKSAQLDIRLASGISSNSYFTLTPTLLTLATGTMLAADNVYITQTTLTYASTTNIDFSLAGTRKESLTGNVTFTTSNLAAGRSVVVKILCDSSARTFTFPGSWIFVGAAAPTGIAANKTGILSLTAYGTTDADVVAAYAVQP
jgi:hypothetical protein